MESIMGVRAMNRRCKTGSDLGGDASTWRRIQVDRHTDGKERSMEVDMVLPWDRRSRQGGRQGSRRRGGVIWPLKCGACL